MMDVGFLKIFLCPRVCIKFFWPIFSLPSYSDFQTNPNFPSHYSKSNSKNIESSSTSLGEKLPFKDLFFEDLDDEAINYVIFCDNRNLEVRPDLAESQVRIESIESSGFNSEKNAKKKQIFRTFFIKTQKAGPKRFPTNNVQRINLKDLISLFNSKKRNFTLLSVFTQILDFETFYEMVLSEIETIKNSFTSIESVKFQKAVNEKILSFLKEYSSLGHKSIAEEDEDGKESRQTDLAQFTFFCQHFLNDYFTFSENMIELLFLSADYDCNGYLSTREFKSLIVYLLFTCN